MKKIDKYILKGKIIITLSIFFLIAGVSLSIVNDLKSKSDDYQVSYEYVNIKDMASAKVTTKKEETKGILTSFTNTSRILNQSTPTEVSLQEEIKETALPLVNESLATQETPKQIWYLPTEYGEVSQYPSYGHVAFDITSPRGYNEYIYPIANGIVSGIYSDGAGAKIVTVSHNINGQYYTSQYVHLSQYATGLYVGQPVTINDVLGLMGSTGRSTGVHLHIAVLDCNLFDSNDTNCSDLNGFFRYANQRLNAGYYGLGTMINVPASWTSR